MIVAEHLTKRFGTHAAIEDVSFEVAQGSVVGFLGPNGAGKTTTLRLLAGVLPPTSGRALVDGHDLVQDPIAARRRLGYAPERPALYLEMRVAAMLEFAAVLRDAATEVDAVLERTGLAPLRDRPIRTLSKGVRQRIGLALALIGEPPVLLLDEPLAGLDPAQSADARRLIRDLGADHAVLVSSHALGDVETMCDRVVILHRGRVLAIGEPAALAARLRRGTRIDVEAAAPPMALADALASIPGVCRVDPLDGAGHLARVRIHTAPEVDVRALVVARIAAEGWQLLEVASVEASLEEAFLALVAPPPSPS